MRVVVYGVIARKRMQRSRWKRVRKMLRESVVAIIVIVWRDRERWRRVSGRVAQMVGVGDGASTPFVGSCLRLLLTRASTGLLRWFIAVMKIRLARRRLGLGLHLDLAGG
jgi:hypothetical protein